jgi:hypothetical protein
VTPPPTTPVSSSLSLTPSDSVSQGLTGDIGRALRGPPSEATARPLMRPSHLPLAILWTYKDCKHDPQVGITDSNKSRMPMHRAIRHENGTLITLSQWRLIQASACAVAHSTLTNLFASDPRTAGSPCKKKYFKTYFLEEWQSALIQLETAAPLLVLCAGNWKADLTLGTTLLDGLVLPSRPSSPLPEPSLVSSEPSSAPDPLDRRTQTMPAGGKSKRVRNLSPLPHLRKKAKSVGHKDSTTGMFTSLDSFQMGLNFSQVFQAIHPRPRPHHRPQHSSTWLIGLQCLRDPGLDLLLISRASTCIPPVSVSFLLCCPLDLAPLYPANNLISTGTPVS